MGRRWKSKSVQLASPLVERDKRPIIAFRPIGFLVFFVFAACLAYLRFSSHVSGNGRDELQPAAAEIPNAAASTSGFQLTVENRERPAGPSPRGMVWIPEQIDRGFLNCPTLSRNWRFLRSFSFCIGFFVQQAHEKVIFSRIDWNNSAQICWFQCFLLSCWPDDARTPFSIFGAFPVKSFEATKSGPAYQIGFFGRAKQQNGIYEVGKHFAQRGVAQQGRFLDLRTLVWALRNVSYNLQGACKAFKVIAKVDHKPSGQVSPKEIDYCRGDVGASFRLLNTTMAEFNRNPVDLKPDKGYSPASIAKAYLQ